VIKAAWSADQPSFAGKYMNFSGATFAPLFSL
jgi:alkanesulfonate monooxygenase SsuD/methylene tetrahydromethanopterin reductase-like flavin-dependent oxidoreductase (luciferase family)